MSSAVDIRRATEADLTRINEIYNHYVRESPATFDLAEMPLEERRAWYDQFAESGPHQLLVAEEMGLVLGYAYSHRFRDRAAYFRSIETSVYCAPDATGRGLGSALYGALFEAIAGADIHVLIAGVTLPNAASVALHRRFGFQPAGVMHEVGYKFERFWDVGWYEKRFD